MDPRGLSALTAFAYVGSVYIFPGGRSNRRDDLPVLIRRLLGVLILTGFTVFNFGHGRASWLLNFDRDVAVSTAKAFGMLHLIYAPSLLAFGVPRVSLKNWQHRLMVFRDLLVGPITEELVYRGTLYDIYREGQLSGESFLRENFWYFGIAHIHHALMAWLGETLSLKKAFLQAAVQFTMTGLFGTYASYWLVQTGSVWPSVVSHLVCNFYGPPRLTGPLWYMATLPVGVAIWAYCLRFI